MVTAFSILTKFEECASHYLEESFVFANDIIRTTRFVDFRDNGATLDILRARPDEDDVIGTLNLKTVHSESGRSAFLCQVTALPSGDMQRQFRLAESDTDAFDVANDLFVELKGLWEGRAGDYLPDEGNLDALPGNKQSTGSRFNPIFQGEDDDAELQSIISQAAEEAEVEGYSSTVHEVEAILAETRAAEDEGPKLTPIKQPEPEPEPSDMGNAQLSSDDIAAVLAQAAAGELDEEVPEEDPEADSAVPGINPESMSAAERINPFAELGSEPGDNEELPDDVPDENKPVAENTALGDDDIAAILAAAQDGTIDEIDPDGADEASAAPPPPSPVAAAEESSASAMQPLSEQEEAALEEVAAEMGIDIDAIEAATPEDEEDGSAPSFGPQESADESDADEPAEAAAVENLKPEPEEPADGAADPFADLLEDDGESDGAEESSDEGEDDLSVDDLWESLQNGDGS